MSRMARQFDDTDGTIPCECCGIADKTVKRKWFPLALPTDSYYGSEAFSHDEDGCYDALLKWKDEHK